MHQARYARQCLTGSLNQLRFPLLGKPAVPPSRSVWMKMAGGAVATPILLVVVLNKQRRRGGPTIDFTSPVTLATLAGSVVVGAILGALLTAKDVVQRHLAEGQHVALPWALLFGKGLISLLCVGFPLVIFATFVVTMLTLGI